jgi:large subunit ribosomal protein L13
MNDTFIPRSDYSTKKWYIIDANQKSVGRVATAVSSILQGKHKVDYHPSIDLGDYIIVINAKNMHLEALKTKYHVFSPGRPGSSLKKLVNRIPRKIVEGAVRNMLPKGLRSSIPRRLKVYDSSEHPHSAQNPILLQ